MIFSGVGMDIFGNCTSPETSGRLRNLCKLWARNNKVVGWGVGGVKMSQDVKKNSGGGVGWGSLGPQAPPLNPPLEIIITLW